MNYSELMTTGIQKLSQAGFEEARTDVRSLLFYVCKIDYMTFLRDADSEVTKEQEQIFYNLLEERLKHVPVQYLIGEQEFCGLVFQVRPGVLIPRPETELLAEAVFRASEGKRVLDMCTGSGCIAVTVAKLGKPQSVAASDYSEAALEIAKENAGRQEVPITFYQGDLFENVEGIYDIIVSNPPYIKTAVVEELMPEVKDYEPHLALDGKEDGLHFYRRIAGEAKDYLCPGGRLMFEIGYDQGEEVSRLLDAEGYKEIEVKKDYAGLDRMVFAVWPGESKENRNV